MVKDYNLFWSVKSNADFKNLGKYILKIKFAMLFYLTGPCQYQHSQ